MTKNPVMVEAGRKAAATRKRNQLMREQMSNDDGESVRSNAAIKAWQTIKQNKKDFKGFEKSDAGEWALHVVRTSTCIVPGYEETLFFLTKKSMLKEIKKIENDENVQLVIVLEPKYVKTDF